MQGGSEVTCGGVSGVVFQPCSIVVVVGLLYVKLERGYSTIAIKLHLPNITPLAKVPMSRNTGHLYVLWWSADDLHMTSLTASVSCKRIDTLVAPGNTYGLSAEYSVLGIKHAINIDS